MGGASNAAARPWRDFSVSSAQTEHGRAELLWRSSQKQLNYRIVLLGIAEAGR